jgi:hypothetical protein
MVVRVNLDKTDLRPRLENRAVMFGFKPGPGALKRAPLGIERV